MGSYEKVAKSSELGRKKNEEELLMFKSLRQARNNGLDLLSS